MNAADLSIGEQILSLDGDYGTVELVIVVEDVYQLMYNLTVADVHTFVVGEGAWVVHNLNGCKLAFDEIYNGERELGYDTLNGIEVATFTLDPDGMLTMSIKTKKIRVDAQGNMVTDQHGMYEYVDATGFNVSASAIFNDAWSRVGSQVKQIRGNWFSAAGISGNFDRFVYGIRQGLSGSQAAAATWTGKMASDRNFNNVSVEAMYLDNVGTNSHVIGQQNLNQLEMSSEINNGDYDYNIIVDFTP